jgi:hypothetical protein
MSLLQRPVTPFSVGDKIMVPGDKYTHTITSVISGAGTTGYATEYKVPVNGKIITMTSSWVPHSLAVRVGRRASRRNRRRRTTRKRSTRRH